MEEKIKLLEKHVSISEHLLDRISKKMPNIMLFDECLAIISSQKNIGQEIIKKMKSITGGLPEYNELITEANEFAQKSMENSIMLRYLLPIEFDLLCLVGDREIRMSFEKGKSQKVIGIFPFRHSSLYLDVEESKMTQRCKVDNDCIPKIHVWEDIFRMINPLNECLNILQLPILEGSYFAKQNHSSKDDNLIIKIEQDKKQLNFGMFSFDTPAKARYLKIHQSKGLLNLMSN